MKIPCLNTHQDLPPRHTPWPRYTWTPAVAGVVTVVAALLLAACTPTKAVRGNMLDDHLIAQVVPGVSSQSDVMRALGSPTTTDPFNTDIWYYIGQKTEKKGILDPKVTTERIFRLTFDPTTRVLLDMTPLDTARNDIPISRAATPTLGTEMNAVQQIIGNIGKFNKSQSTSPTRPGGM
jgi:outer membrane protein assembly factor BamE (lipoprotein component of BamABCDE complex)